MTISLGAVSRIAWQWINEQTQLPKGVLLEIRDRDLRQNASECRVILVVNFHATGEQKRYRLVSLLVNDQGAVAIADDRTEYVSDELLLNAGYDIDVQAERTTEVYVQYLGYSTKNRPENVEDATEWLNAVLRTKENRVLDQLESTSEDDFERPDDYYNWKDRANKALQYTQEEIKYVNGWISSQNPKALANVEAQRLERAAQIAAEPKPAAESESEPEPTEQEVQIAELSRLVEEKAAGMEASYRSLYSTADLPPSPQAALQRKMILDEMTAESELFQEQLRQQAIVGVSRRALVDILRPLFILDKKLGAESKVVRAYLQQNVTDHVLALLSITDRIISEGFELTEDEYASLSMIAGIYKYTN